MIFGTLAQSLILPLSSGLEKAMFLFLLASGLSLIFGVSRTLNLAHGSFYMVAAYLGYTFVRIFPSNLFGFIVSVIIAAVSVMCLGGVVEVVLLRRVYRSGELYIVLITFSLILILEAAVTHFWGTGLLSVPLPGSFNHIITIDGAPIPLYNLLLIGLGIVIGAILWWAVYRTRWGLNVRAAAVDREMASALGLNEKRLFTYVFLVGSLLAGLAGALAAPLLSLQPTMDADIIIQVFAVVVIGGLGSLTGSLVAAILIGELEAFGVISFPSLALPLLFLVMAVTLVIRPWGLFGREGA